MTDRTQPEALDFADWLEAVGDGLSTKRCAALLREQHALLDEQQRTIAALNSCIGRETTTENLTVVDRLEARIADLEAQLEAVGAGGVNGPLVGIATPPTAQAEGWRPIETAPKDGQAILVTEGRFCYCVEWNEEIDWWAVDDNKLGPFRLRGSSPTHWMPLPPPPTSAEGVEHG